MTTQRQLAAIMFTDIVGYTAMMQVEENMAISAVKKHQEILEHTVKIHRGKVFQYYGDGSLSIFKSATDAVQCAIDIQEQLREETNIPLRIGIHIGEILIEKERIFGDGVNVASRVQSLGVSGSILITDTIFHLIRNQSRIKAVSLGSYKLKIFKQNFILVSGNKE